MRRDLFPPIEPYISGYLQVSPLHTLYWEQSGNPEGLPVLFLHGGPGAGASPTHRRFFNPQDWRIIIFDQRGAGRSTPLGETRENTTELLIKDIELLRQKLGIRQWHLFGGSWGSTLALAYAQTHPQAVLGLMLRGICLLRPLEVDWFLYGIRHVFPEAWERFANFIEAAKRDDLLSAYIERMESEDPAIRRRAVQLWSGYESACSTLLPTPDALHFNLDDKQAYAIARLEAHYFKHELFTPADRLLQQVGRIRHIPGIMVQGRYDMICPMISAHDLHAAWPEAQYVVVPDAGHSAMEMGIRQALIEAAERFKKIK